MFSVKRFFWFIKKEDHSWNREYFRETILKELVIPFFKSKETVISLGDAIFLHDKAYEKWQHKNLFRIITLLSGGIMLAWKLS